MVKRETKTNIWKIKITFGLGQQHAQYCFVLFSYFIPARVHNRPKNLLGLGTMTDEILSYFIHKN